MQLFCFIITFGTVNILAIDDVDYKKQVVYTNAAIELAYNTNDLTVGGKSEANGLEYVIEKIVHDDISANQDGFAKLNFMIAAPEKTEIVGNISRPELENLQLEQKCIHFQKVLQQEIISTLNITTLEVDESQDFGSLELENLADQRRSRVKSALKNIIGRALVEEFVGLKLAALAEKRRITGKEFLENIVGRHVSKTRIPVLVEDYYGFIYDLFVGRLCRYIALYMSTRFPSSNIEKLTIHPHGTCTLDGITQQKYNKIKNVWWRISPQPKVQLEDLLGIIQA